MNKLLTSIAISLPMILFCVCLVHARQSSSPEAAHGVTLTDSIKPLQMGDTIPEELWNLPLQVVNHPDGKDTITLNDYKGKLIILDFWAAWCGSCIKMFPKLSGIDSSYSGRLSVLLVNSKDTKDKEEKIKDFFEDRPNLNLPSIIHDTELKTLFPHRTIPHYIWIKDNTVRAITSADEINKKNIDHILTDPKAVILSKKRENFDPKYPLLPNGDGEKSGDFLYRSVFTGYIDGLHAGSGIQFDRPKMATKIYCINSSVLNLYKKAYPSLSKFKRNRIIYDLTDRELFSDPNGSNEWKQQHLYSYELSFPSTAIDSALKWMQADLQRFFGIYPRTEIKSTKCLLLKIADRKEISFGNSEGNPRANLNETDGREKYLKNYPLAVLLSHLENILLFPILDETGLEDPVNLKLPADLKDLKSLRSYLERQGFALAEENRKVAFLMLTDRPFNEKN